MINSDEQSKTVSNFHCSSYIPPDLVSAGIILRIAAYTKDVGKTANACAKYAPSPRCKYLGL